MRIITRQEWGGKAPTSRRTIQLPTPELYIHHTVGALDAGGNGVWWDDVRGIQDFHMRPVNQGGRGWSDIAYSFVVGGGQVFEGRGVGIAGSHTGGRNSVSHAICLIGNYDAWQPDPQDVQAIADIVRHGREQEWWGDITGGHRDAPEASTACPGRHLQAAIPDIRILADLAETQEDDVPAPTDVTNALTTPSGKGRWLLQYDGGIITEGDAPFLGSYPALPAKARQGKRGFYIITSRDDGRPGYMLVGTDRSKYRF